MADVESDIHFTDFSRSECVDFAKIDLPRCISSTIFEIVHLSSTPRLVIPLSLDVSISQYLDISLSQVFIARAFSFKNEKSAKNPKILALFCCILFFHPDPTYVLGETLQYAHWLSLSSGDIVSFSLSTRKRTLRSMLLSLYL